MALSLGFFVRGIDNAAHGGGLAAGALLGVLLRRPLGARRVPRRERALAGAALYFWRRSVLLTMAVGMAVYLPLHLALGW